MKLNLIIMIMWVAFIALVTAIILKVIFCGDCTKLTCENCSIRFLTSEPKKNILDNYSYEQLFDMTAGYDLAHRD